MAELVYEYRVTKARRSHTDLREIVMTFREGDEMWDMFAIGRMPGAEGIAQVTASEQKADGQPDVRIERREVGPWEPVEVLDVPIPEDNDPEE